MRDSWEQNFRTKDGRQIALTGCSRSSETRAQWTDVRAATDCEVPALQDENIDQVNDRVLSQEDQSELTPQSVKYHGWQAFLSHLLSALYERICSWNALRGDVRKSWLRRTALLVSNFWRTFSADLIFFSDEEVFTVAAAVKELWKSVKISPS